MTTYTPNGSEYRENVGKICIDLHTSSQTAVLGGLVTDNVSDTTTQLPILGDIPLLGWLFKNESSTRQRVNLIVFVTPQIIRSPEEVEDNLRRVLDERRNQMKSEYDRIFGGGHRRTN